MYKIHFQHQQFTFSKHDPFHRELDPLGQSISSSSSSSSWCCFVFCRHFDCYGFLMATSYSIRGRAAKKTMTAPKSFRVVVSQKHVKIKTSHYTSYQSSVKRKQKKSNIVDVHKQTDVKMMMLESFLSFRSLGRIQNTYYILAGFLAGDFILD